MKDMEKLQVTTILLISFLFFCCQDGNKKNSQLQYNNLIIKSNKEVLKVHESDFTFNEDENSINIKVKDPIKWNMIKTMEILTIELKISKKNILAKPLFVLNSATEHKYTFPIDNKGKLFYDDQNMISIVKN
ncbi:MULTISPECIES: hypothetical protein [Aquimarina]|uniref:Uncharacterized protein n=1 Tax=Aquimarina algiphila TaxID=2047982 RepID=A0A554VGY2_9FLAO|nr:MULTISPECIES: hypothetical protein [Aquimarina]TSE06691.1 hypothetical protein FOF46_18460 [Aquimarina algiphila]